MTPLAWCVIALAVGCVAGGAAGLGPEPAVRVALLAIAGLVLAGRLAWGGHGPVALGLAVSAACSLGVGLGALAEARAWDPPGLDVEALERASAAGDGVRLDGVLRRDAWVSPSGGVSLDLQVRRVRWRGRWVAATLGVRATVVGDSAAGHRGIWTRGRAIEAPVTAVRRPLPYRNVGVPDAERALARRGLRLFATVKSASLIATTPGPWWEEAAASARARVRAVVARHVTDPTGAATVTAILIGDRSSLGADVVRDLQHAGVYHVVAISGGNVGIWLALLMGIPHATGLGVRAAMLWLAAGLLGFAVVVDGGASVARAVMVAAVVIAARWWDIRASAMQALVVAGGLQLILDPLSWHDAGCVLSFGAAGTLVAFASLWPGQERVASARRSRWRRALWGLGAILGATLAIELMLLPVTARWFNVATAAGLIANVLAVPAMGVVQVAGLALLPAASAWPALGSMIGVAATYGVHALMRSADVVAVAPWLVREVPPPSLGVLAAYYGALAGAVVAARGKCRDAECRECRRSGAVSARRAATMTCAAVAAGCLAWIVRGGVEHSLPTPWTWLAAARWQRASWRSEPWLLITVLDVGQGDATVVRFPSGRTWLVDAGGSAADTFDTGGRVTSPALWALGHRRLDRVLVTHAHPDHAAGMPTVIRRFAPREVLSGIPIEGDLRQEAVSAASRASASRERPLAMGESFADGPVHVSVLHPERPDWERRRVRNDDSVVLWVRFGDVGVLLPGDIGQAVEARVASRLAAAPLTVLRLAHHGSASSTSHTLLDTLRPALAIASMARGNQFGHPSMAVVRHLGDRRIPLLRTDQAGAIQLATNGRVLLVRTMTGIEGSLRAGSPPRAWWLATPPPSDPASPRRGGGPPPRASPRQTRSGE